MVWLSLHKASEALAVQAHAAMAAHEAGRAEKLFCEAAQAEEDALAALGMDKPRTYGITAVSAVSLWFKGKNMQRAAQLAHRCLAMPALPEPAREQLDDLVRAVYADQDKARMTGVFLPGSVVVSVAGTRVLHGAAPLELIVEKVKTLQALYFRVIELSKGKTLRRRGGPTKDITGAFEPWLVQEPAGSFRFSVAIKTSGQADLFDSEQLEAVDISKRFLGLVTVLANDPTGEASRQLVPDDAYRGVLRKLIRNLTPAPKSGETVSLSAKDSVDATVKLDEATRPRLDANIRAELPTPDEKAGETPEDLAGVLRAVDLDEDWLKVEVDGKQVQVSGVSQAVDDVIGPMVNKAVLVRTIRPRRGALRFVDINLEDQAPE